MCTGIIFFGKPFIYFWAGPGYDDAYIIVLLLIIPGMVPLTQNLGIEMQRAQNLHKYRSIIYGAMAIGNLAISIWLCQYLGAIGCAIGTAVAVALANGLVMNIFYQRRLNIDVTVFWGRPFSVCQTSTWAWLRGRSGRSAAEVAGRKSAVRIESV